MELRESPSHIFAVVVTFNPAPAVFENVCALAAQAGRIFVIDNGSSGSCAETLDKIETLPGVQLIRNPSNLGIGAALNLGIRHAMQLGAEWIATFDQDSRITPQYFLSLNETLAGHPDPQNVALIAPTIVLAPEISRPTSQKTPADYFPVRVAMTSGSLIRTREFTKFGYYDESMFIDYVDFDLCLRLSGNGRQLIQSRRAFLRHNLGARTRHSLLGFTFHLTSHNAVRRYYITRNRFVIYRRYAAAFPGWTLYDLAWMMLEFAKIICFEPQKIDKLAHAWRGFRHALSGIAGPISNPSLRHAP